MGAITPQERRLIDEALARTSEQERRVPTGRSAFHVDYRWTGSRLEAVAGADMSWRGKGGELRPDTRRAHRAPQSNPRSREDVLLDEAIAESIRDGLSITQVAARHSVGAVRIRRVAREGNLTIARIKSQSAARAARTAELDARVLALADGTRSMAEIARALKITPSVVHRRRERLQLNVRERGEQA